MKRIGTTVHRLWADRNGNVALIFALALPAIALIALGAIELMNLSKDRSRLQDIADATALNAAAQMRVAANEQLLSRAVTYAETMATGLTARLDRPVVRLLDAEEGPGGIEVNLTARRTSFFGNLLPPGGFVIRVSARAQQLGATPLCVLGLSTSTADAIDLKPGAIIARSCLVHSNKDIKLSGASTLEAASVQAVGAIKGTGATNAGSGAPPLDDPLAGMFQTADPGPCQHTSGVKAGAPPVAPGIHCRHFDIENGPLTFAAGIHHLKDGELQLKKGAQILGENVTLIIWRKLKVTYSDGQVPLLSLSGTQGGMGEAGHWAGFALAVDPARGGDLSLNFQEIRRLEGVVYAPTTRLIVPGGVDSTEVTPWTVVVAKDLRIEGGRRLLINADYATSAVPVPNGVGNKAQGGSPVRLTD